MQAWTRSSYVNVFHDQRMQFNEVIEDHRLVMARNEYQSFQICIRSEDAFTINGVTFDDLTCDGGRIPACMFT